MIRPYHVAVEDHSLGDLVAEMVSSSWPAFFKGRERSPAHPAGHIPQTAPDAPGSAGNRCCRSHGLETRHAPASTGCRSDGIPIHREKGSPEHRSPCVSANRCANAVWQAARDDAGSGREYRQDHKHCRHSRSALQAGADCRSVAAVAWARPAGSREDRRQVHSAMKRHRLSRSTCHVFDRRSRAAPSSVTNVVASLVILSFSFRNMTPIASAKTMLVSRNAVTRAIGAWVKDQMTRA